MMRFATSHIHAYKYKQYSKTVAKLAPTKVKCRSARLHEHPSSIEDEPEAEGQRGIKLVSSTGWSTKSCLFYCLGSQSHAYPLSSRARILDRRQKRRVAKATTTSIKLCGWKCSRHATLNVRLSRRLHIVEADNKLVIELLDMFKAAKECGYVVEVGPHEFDTNCESSKVPGGSCATIAGSRGWVCAAQFLPWFFSFAATFC